ncbi:hypothetical protein ACFL24_02690 [Patescibacteria group bacterium]
MVSKGKLTGIVMDKLYRLFEAGINNKAKKDLFKSIEDRYPKLFQKFKNHLVESLVLLLKNYTLQKSSNSNPEEGFNNQSR